MTNEQAEEMLQLLRDIRQQITRLANATAHDNQFVFYGTQPLDKHGLLDSDHEGGS